MTYVGGLAMGSYYQGGTGATQLSADFAAAAAANATYVRFDMDWWNVASSGGGFTVDAAGVTSNTITATAHGQGNGQAVMVWGSLPAPLVAGTTYFVVGAAANTFQLAATSGGGVIDLTTTTVAGRWSSVNWSAMDALVTATTTNGLQAVALVNQTPPWANASAGQYAPATSTADLQAFADAAFRRYGPQGVRLWEVSNEVNLPNAAGRATPSATTYTNSFLIPAATGLRAAATALGLSMQVLFAGLAPGDGGGSEIQAQTYLASAYTAGAKPYFDIMAYHPYAGDQPEGATVGNPGYNIGGAGSAAGGRPAAILAAMTTAADGAKQIWATEYGRPTNNGTSNIQAETSTEARQAQHVIAAYATWAAQANAGPLLWYQMRDQATYAAATGREQLFGLKHSDGTVKAAYATLTTTLAPAGPIVIIVAPPAVDYGPGLRWLSGRGMQSISRSGQRSARVDVLRDGRTVRRIDASDPSLRIVGGSVQVDRATVSRNGSVILFDDSGTLLPDDVNDLLAPLIGELRFWVGVRYWDWTTAEALAGTDWEWVPIGTLPVMEISGAGRNAYTVSCLDRMQFLTAFPFNYPITSGTLHAQALLDLLSFFVPAGHLQTNLPASTEHTTGSLLYEEGADAAEVAHDLAQSMGLRLYADAMGVMTAAAEPSTEDSPAVVFGETDGARIVVPGLQQGVSVTSAVNAVTFTGEDPAGAPVRGYAEDTNASSLTYRQRVGYRPAPRQSSPLMRTNEQCGLAAKTWLQRNLGLAGTLTVPTIPNPALESGDVIRAVDVERGIDVVTIADSFSVSLKITDGAQEIATRARVLR